MSLCKQVDRVRAAGALVLAGLGVFLGGCVFTSVGNNLEQDTCVGKPPAFCDELNDSNPTGDDCLRWSCDKAAGVCQILPRDLDHDGSPAAQCALLDVTADCDDNNPAVRGLLADGSANHELCDGLDNDCNGWVDDGAYTVGKPTVLFEDKYEKMEHFAVAQDSDMKVSFLFAAKRIDTGTGAGDSTVAMSGNEESVNEITASGPSRSPPSPPIVPAKILKVTGAALQYNSFLHEFQAVISDTSGYWLGRLEGSIYTVAEVASPHKALSMSLVGGQDSQCVLVSYLNDGAPCGISSSTCVASIKLQNQGPVGSCGTNDLIELGTTNDLSPVAMVQLSSSKWLVAHADVSKDIQFDVVTIDSYAVKRTPPGGNHTITAALEPGEVDMAISDDLKEVALVYRSGSGFSTSLHLVLLTLDAEDKLSKTAETTFAGGRNVKVRRPHIMRRKLPSAGWLVTWDEDHTAGNFVFVSAPVLNFESGLTFVMPKATTVIGKALGNVLGLDQGLRMVRGADNGVVVYAPSQAGLQRVELSCLPQ